MTLSLSTDPVGPSREFVGRWSVADVSLATTDNKAKHHFRGVSSGPDTTIHKALYKKYSLWLQENGSSDFWILQFAVILKFP
jgi:hypothetical protein